MLSAFTITEIRYLMVSLFYDLVRPPSYLYLRCKVESHQFNEFGIVESVGKVTNLMKYRNSLKCRNSL